jgi:hypothetical protein
MVPILANEREAKLPAFLATRIVFLTKIPAARSLTEIAANRGHIAHLRRRSRHGNVAKCRPLLLHFGLPGELRESRERANTKSATRGINSYSLQLRYLADVNNYVRSHETFFEQI